ncbi:glycoside hydrolase family 12 protein [Salinactinospora qingdaonensis]|uniref:Glycosyl hydrolase family 12 n=1 Tax=Salinactinospora qingdaonensis TaxID=702744 RepID=A0ABP7GB88_9ACTN
MHPRLRSLILAPLMTLALLAMVGTPAHAAAWSSSDRWGTWTDQGYILYNNVWGSGHGYQGIWANSYHEWGVYADHPDTGGVKSYPNVTWNVDRRISEITDLTSSFEVDVPNGGAYATSYDIWDVNHDYEIMLWMNQHGPVGPLGSYQTTTSVGGHTWNVYRGSNGANEVFSFIRTSDTSAATVDIEAVLDWLDNAGWMGDVILGDVQFGYEITSSAGGLEFVTNDYAVAVN